MELKHKVGLALVGAVATAGMAYCAYLHRDDIASKIDDLKNDIINKKNELGEAGHKKIGIIVDSMINALEKYASSERSAEDAVRHNDEIQKLREEIASLKN